MTKSAISKFVLSDEHKQALFTASLDVKEPQLARILTRGVGYHHAGMEPSDRDLIEQLFRDRVLPVLCTTSTLSVGVNLPAHLVIIASTIAWRGQGSGYQEIPRAQILQMLGRAGRPGYDTEGVGVVMAKLDDRTRL